MGLESVLSPHDIGNCIYIPHSVVIYTESGDRTDLHKDSPSFSLNVIYLRLEIESMSCSLWFMIL